MFTSRVRHWLCVDVTGSVVDGCLCVVVARRWSRCAICRWRATPKREQCASARSRCAAISIVCKSTTPAVGAMAARRKQRHRVTPTHRWLTAPRRLRLSATPATCTAVAGATRCRLAAARRASRLMPIWRRRWAGVTRQRRRGCRRRRTAAT